MRTPSHWRDRRQNTQLAARKCEGCGFVSFPERQRICKRCGRREDWVDVTLRREGEVQSYVIQRTLPDEFETPLPFAVVDLPQDGDSGGDPGRVYGILTETDPAELEIGTRVVADFRRMYDVDGVPIHSFKFSISRGDR